MRDEMIINRPSHRDFGEFYGSGYYSFLLEPIFTQRIDQVLD